MILPSKEMNVPREHANPVEMEEKRSHRQAALEKDNTAMTTKAETTVIEQPSLNHSSRRGRHQHSVPRRTSSISKPAKRKRHEDLVAFHRNSCQIFSSIDAMIAQSRHSASSSSCSSSSSWSTRSSPVLPPASEPSTRNTSVDSCHFDNSTAEPFPARTNRLIMKSNPQPKRPALQRTQRIGPSPSPVPLICTEPTTNPPTPANPNISPRPSIQTNTTPSYSTLSTHTQNPTSTQPIIWNSPTTRRREQARIDAAHSGLRLLIRTLFPRAMCKKIGGGRVGFCDERAVSGSGGNDKSKENGDGDDCGGSVRRYRVSVEDEDGEDVHLVTDTNVQGHLRDKEIGGVTVFEIDKSDRGVKGEKVGFGKMFGCFT